uniref:Mating-type protein MAT-1 n=1 Tax=Pyrenophora tritici-repentis TaxID=45151 RepID=B5QT46_9PLEO|nr:mating type 1-1 protein [Pyrenophora tritici-repentis]
MTNQPPSHLSNMAAEGLNATMIRDPTNAEIAEFLANRSGAQMLQLMRYIREPAAQVAFANQMMNLPAPVSNRRATPELVQKPKKALNAFVGFRCYYIDIPAFKSWPMKKLSNLLGILWESDPNKPLWSLLAKAWSMLRDQLTKEVAPLDEFFGIVCTELGVPHPDWYLEANGWILSHDQDGNPTLSREAGIEPTVATAADKALSVEDIIRVAQGKLFAMTYKHGLNGSSTFLAERMAPHNTSQDDRTPAELLAFEAALQAEIHNIHEYMITHQNGPVHETSNHSATLPNGEHNPLYNQIMVSLAEAASDADADAGAPAANVGAPAAAVIPAFNAGAPVAIAAGIPDFDNSVPAAVAEGMSDFNDGAPAFGMETGFTAPSTPFSMGEAFHQSTFGNAVPYENDAFRVGADEDATLPTFDGANNA